MKIRDSGMPDESYWESLFDVPLILSRLEIDQYHDVAELGCGYGTFTVPVAKSISGKLYTFDVDQEMVTRTKARVAHLPVRCEMRDVPESGFGVRVDAVLLFNILHCEEPVRLMRHAVDALRPGGRVLAIHWRHDIATLRGPKADIRPRPQQIVQWAEDAGLQFETSPFVLPPWHYGLRFVKIDD